MLKSVRLEEYLSSFPSLLIGYSGGVDSTTVAVAARRVLGRERSLAVLGVSPSLAAVQRQQARRIATNFDLALLEVETGELDDPQYAANPTNRCYFCKRELWSTLQRVAETRNLAVVADGTNADDLQGHRPGARAAEEHSVRSPLRDMGFTKRDVRAVARCFGIPIWDAPASPCLASRIQFGLPVNTHRLTQVERGETFLRALGIGGDLRVRHRGSEARIEAAPEAFALLRKQREQIASAFWDFGFSAVTLDLDGYRSGSFLSSPNSRYEVLAKRV